VDQLTLPLARLNQNLSVSLSRPERVAEDPLEVTYIGAQQRGVTLSGLLSRGIYSLRGRKLTVQNDATTQKPLWEIPLAVNGASEESDLAPATSGELEQAASGADIRFVAAGETINLSGAATRWQSSWWWLTLGVLTLLLAEMLVLIKP